MSNTANDKYTREGDDNSQVRNIINQLNNDKPSQEKNREVVVRADGTKVVRVTKKRRVMVSNAEKNRRSRKKLLMGVLVFFLLIASVIAFYMYRMSQMCSESFLNEKKQEMCAAWGATSVEIINPRVEGSTLSIDRLVAHFPESDMLESVELNGLSASLDMASFFTEEFRSDNLLIKVANIRLRPGHDKLDIPVWQGAEPIWNIKSVTCAKLNFSIGDPKTSPIAISNAEVQMYPSSGADYGQVITISKGTLTLAGIGRELGSHLRYKFNILDAKMFITSVSVEDIRLSCQDPNSLMRNKDNNRDAVSSANARELVSSDFVIYGRIGGGESLYSGYEVEVEHLPLDLLTHGVFDKVFGAEVSSSRVENAEKIKLVLSPDGAPAQFSGRMMLNNVVFRDADLDAKSVFITHIVNGNQNRKYSKIAFSMASVDIRHENGEILMDIPQGAMEESGSVDISVFGKVKVGMHSANGQWNDLPLSGELSYSLPRHVLNNEYKGGVIDPIFEADPKNDLRCIFKTTLSGVSIMPKDDSRARVRATEETRRTLERAERLYDVDVIPDALQKESDPTDENQSADKGIFGDDIFMPKGERKVSDDEFFGRKSEDDIFKRAPETVPVDSSVKF